MEYPGIEKSIREMARILDIDLVETPEQTCCSGYLMTCQAYQPMTSLAVTARNLSIPERMGLDVFFNCNGCFAWNTEFKHMLDHNKQMRQEVDRVLQKFNCTYHGTASLYHFQELWYKMRDEIKKKQVRSLGGLPIGVHYGCHYLAKKYGIIDDVEYPTFMEELVEMLDGKPVFYSTRRDCCGGGVGAMFRQKQEIAVPHSYMKIRKAKEEGVELMITMCPGCNVQLDRSQAVIKEQGLGDFNVPVIDIAQLLAWTSGVPEEMLGFEYHTIPVVIRREGSK